MRRPRNLPTLLVWLATAASHVCSKLDGSTAVLLRGGTGVLPCLNDCGANVDQYGPRKMDLPPRGVCIDGHCICSPGFSGDDCTAGSYEDAPAPLESVKAELAAEDAKGAGAESEAEAKKEEGDEKEEKKPTCDGPLCSSICTFGGACISKSECQCYDRWSHGPPEAVGAVLEDESPSPGGESAGASSAHAASDKLVIVRKPMKAADRSIFVQFLSASGAPVRPGDPCLTPWTGPNDEALVLCDGDGHITELDFSRMKLKGSISPEVVRLPKLRSLALNNNMLSGQLPWEIGLLQNLENLLIYKNRLTGPIPPSIVNCPLVNIVLYGNQLQGNIPPTLGKLGPSLRYLDLSFNYLRGELPASVVNLAKLETLYVNHNRLEGVIPTTVRNLWSLKQARFEENLFDTEVMNIGSVSVYADASHSDLAEDWYKEWNMGLKFPARNAERKEREKKEMQEERKRQQVARVAAQVAADRKGRAAIAAGKASVDVSGSMAGSGFKDGGDAASSGGLIRAGEDAGPIPDKQPSGSTIMDGT